MSKLKLVPSYKLSFLEYPIRSEWCTTVYTIGCPHKCTGCHNSQLQDVEYSEYDEFEITALLKFFKELADKAQSNNFTIIGGEPLAPWNIAGIKELLRLNNQFNICIYTGYGVNFAKKIGLSGFSFLKTGLYNESLVNPLHSSPSKPDNVFTLATTNQELYDGEYNLISKQGIFKR